MTDFYKKNLLYTYSFKQSNPHNPQNKGYCKKRSDSFKSRQNRIQIDSETTEPLD